MKPNKKIYLISIAQEQYEPCIDFEDYDIDRLPVVQTFIHASYENARKHAVEFIKTEYPSCYDYLFCKSKEVSDSVPELEYGDFCTLEENPASSERFVFKFGYAGNNVGPCMCIQCAELTNITITEKKLLH